MNRWGDFDQIVGRVESVVYILVALILISRSHQHFEMSNLYYNRVFT